MSLLTEVFGLEARYWSLDRVKSEINALPRVWKERYSYLLHDWSRLTGEKLTNSDFLEVDGIPQTK